MSAVKCILDGIRARGKRVASAGESEGGMNMAKIVTGWYALRSCRGRHTEAAYRAGYKVGLFRGNRSLSCVRGGRLYDFWLDGFKDGFYARRVARAFQQQREAAR